MKDYYVYIATNKHRTVLYIGVTNNIERRALEHAFRKDPSSFSAKYQTFDIVYVENYSSPSDAIAREKQLKKWSRKKKLWLIRKANPDMKTLGE